MEYYRPLVNITKKYSLLIQKDWYESRVTLNCEATAHTGGGGGLSGYGSRIRSPVTSQSEPENSIEVFRNFPSYQTKFRAGIQITGGLHPKFATKFWSTAITDATNLARWQILTAVTMKSTIFWHVTPCSMLGVCRRFARLVGFASYNISFLSYIFRK
jgi:hypothetical protein